jgi:hypothetical protein
MVHAIQLGSDGLSESGWPKFWPPVKLPPPPPLSEAARLIWSPKSPVPVPEVDPTYSAQLRQDATSDDGQGRFQMAFLDQRIALMRWDASHAPDARAAVPVESIAA